MPVKISVIGAGSAVFSLAMIKDLVQTPGLANSHVCFMDIDQSRLDAATRLCERYAKERGTTINITKTLCREEALKDADFVVNIALASPWSRWKEGWKIANDLGYRFGGSQHIVHDEAFWINYYQLKLMEEITQDILRICPKAWLLMVANPVSAGVTYLKRKYPELNLVGMCHGYTGVYGVAWMMDLDFKHVSFEAPGINHFLWLTKFLYKGEDAFPMLNKFLEENGEEYIKKAGISSAEGKKPIDLYKRFGAFPLGDTANVGGGAWGHFYHTSKEVEEHWNEDPDTWFGHYFVDGQKTIDKIREVAEDETKSATELVGEGDSGESMVDFIDAIANDNGQIVVVNIMNDKEYVPGVPKDFQVEVQAWVSAKGVQGIHTDRLPKPIEAYLLRDRVAPIEMEIAAFEHGSYEYLLQLVMMDPWTKTEEQARKLLDAILDLPYHTEMKAHYKK